MREKIIFSKRVAYELRKRGCKLLRTEPSKFKPQFDVYVFEETNKLLEVLTELTEDIS